MIKEDPETLHSELIPFLLEIMETKDKTTLHHSARVQRLINDFIPYLIDKNIITADDIAGLWVSAILHDVGKIFVEDEVLLKPGSLDSIEYTHIRNHPERGYNLLKSFELPQNILLAVKHHHERWDGVRRGRYPGYPDGLKGEEIPLYARIISIADAYDAMVGERTYRDPLPKEKAMKILKNNAGKQFDPVLTELFLEMLKNKDTG